MKYRIQRRAGLEGGFTLTEVLVAVAILSLVAIGVVSSNVFGLKLYEVAKTKLGVNDYSRRALSMMIDDIREAHFTTVGTGSATSFIEPAAGVPRQGNALQINPLRDDDTVFIRYYWDEDDQSIKMVNNTNTTPVVVASYVSNSVVFAEENFRGVVLTNRQATSVVALNLNFYKLEYPPVPIGQGGLYEYYHLQTRITRRSAE